MLLTLADCPGLPSSRHIIRTLRRGTVGSLYQLFVQHQGRSPSATGVRIVYSGVTHSNQVSVLRGTSNARTVIMASVLQPMPPVVGVASLGPNIDLSDRPSDWATLGFQIVLL